MASVPVTMDGVLYDLYARTTQRVIFIGEASLTGLSVGGGPIIPPPGGGQPPGNGRPPHVEHPIPPRPDHGLPPIVPVPPDTPNVPPPGSPPVIVGGTHPINPIVPPEAVVIEYPGIGKVVVPLPTQTAPGPAQ